MRRHGTCKLTTSRARVGLDDGKASVTSPPVLPRNAHAYATKGSWSQTSACAGVGKHVRSCLLVGWLVIEVAAGARFAGTRLGNHVTYRSRL